MPDEIKSPSWEEAKAGAQLVEKTETPAEEKPIEPAEPAEKPVAEEPPKKEEKDYEAELDRYKKKLAQQIRANERLQKAKYPEAEPEGGASAPEDIEALVDQKAQEKVEALRRDLAVEAIENILDKLTDNAHERELIKTVYEHEVKPSGWTKAELEADLKKAYLIANADRFEAEVTKKAQSQVRKSMAEEKAVLNASKGASVAGGVGREPPQADPMESLNEREKAWLGKLDDYQKTYGYKK
jgi:hypothetical protein